MSIGQELLNVPMGDMIRQMAFAIADAQLELDESSIRVAELMSGNRLLRDAEGQFVDQEGNPSPKPEYQDTRVFFGPKAPGETLPPRVSMMELGFTPTFYQFIDTIIEVKIAIKITLDTSSTVAKTGDIKKSTTTSTKRSMLFFSQTDAKTVTTTTPVDATYTSKYSYSAEGSSYLRTKLVPVPPPPILEERIRRLMDAQAEQEKTKAGDGSNGT